jgi:hypothetical protein
MALTVENALTGTQSVQQSQSEAPVGREPGKPWGCSFGYPGPC